MEKHSAEKRTEVSKMSTERLQKRDMMKMTYLRWNLLNTYAEYLVTPSLPESPEKAGAVGGMSEAEIEFRRQELEIRKQELEWRQAEAERQRQRDELQRKEKEEEWERRKKEREEDLEIQRQRDELQRKEKEEELERQRQRDELRVKTSGRGEYATRQRE